MNDDQLLRYSRHILLPEIGVEGQEAILGARVLIIGAGGLGSPVAMYLSSAGVGTIVIADDDIVDLTNLQRQILHSADTVGLPKVESARISLHRITPLANIIPLQMRLEGAAMDQHVAAADLVLDCCDNFATRHAIPLPDAPTLPRTSSTVSQHLRRPIPPLPAARSPAQPSRTISQPPHAATDTTWQYIPPD